MTTRLRTLIVDDQPLFRDLLGSLLSGYPDIEVVDAVGNPKDAIKAALVDRPDTVLMDVDLGAEMTGIEVAQEIKRARPNTGIVILSSHKDKEYLRSVVEGHGGGWSYLLKQNVADGAAIVRALKGASWGFVTLDPAIIIDLQPTPDSKLGKLDERQMIVVRYVAGGLDAREIAMQTNLTEAEVATEFDRLCGDLGVTGTSELERRVGVAVAYLSGTHVAVELAAGNRPAWLTAAEAAVP